MTDSRREFLLRIAKGAAYAAPAVVTLATPEGLLGQGQNTNSQKGGMGKGMPCPPGLGMMDACQTVPSAPVDVRGTPGRPSAPWQVRPPSAPPDPSGGKGSPGA